MICKVALSHPCGETASAMAQAAAMMATLAHEKEENAICGEMAAARRMETAEEINTAIEPSTLLVAGTPRREGTLYGCLPIIVPTGSPTASPRPVAR